MKNILILILIFVMSLQLLGLRVVTYNTLNFGENDVERLAHFELILTEIDADIILLQEIEDAGAGDLLLSVLDGYSQSEYVLGPDTSNLLLYKNDLITFASQDTIATDLRNFSEYELLIEGNLLRFYSCHLKASQGNEDLRLEEVTRLRTHLSQLEAGTEFLIVGDMNFYTSSEPGYQKFIADEANNIGRAEDLSDQVGSWNNNSNFAASHTQSTRTTSFGGGASGGLDDRFDFIFSSFELNNGTGLEFSEQSYTPFGNDGEHFNQSINDGTNLVVSPEIADALYEFSDHLPVYADFEVISSDEQILIVTVPNMEEEWQQGTQQSIEWASANFTENVKIELVDSNERSREILIDSTENDGVWEWQIPAAQTLGEFYVKISPASNPAPIDFSNNPLHIIEPTAEVTIYDIQYSLAGPSPLEGEQVITTGIVTGVSDNGYFLQDGIGAWNGIFVYDYYPDVDFADEINITATVAEYYDKTELTEIVMQFAVSSGNELPDAEELTTGEVSVEDYEGVLIQVTNAECISYDPEYGEWVVDDGTGQMMIGDMIYAFIPQIGATYDITGIVDYSYGNFKIEPRFENDISNSTEAENYVINNEIELSNFPNPFNPSSAGRSPTTTISFSLTTDSTEDTKIIIYNLKGQKVKTLECYTELDEVEHSVVWDGTDQNNQPVSSGLYFYQLKIGDKPVAKRKMSLMK